MNKAAKIAQSPDNKPKNKFKRWRLPLIVVGAFVFVILVIFGVFYYQSYVAPFNRTIISIDDTKVTMRYFLNRTRISGSDPVEMVYKITEEQLVKIVASDYGIQVTDAEIDTALRQLAAGDAGTISEIEFRDWYRQQLNTYGITDSQFRELLYIRMLKARMEEYLAGQVPTVAEQVHVYWIVVTTSEEAQAAIERLDAGESFTELAKEISIDTSTNELGGDIGWFPLQASNFYEEIAPLDVNQYTSPIPHYTDTSTSTDTTSAIDAYLIFMVSEKDPARVIDENNLAILQSLSFENWYDIEITKHDIKYYFNSEIYAWLNYQLQKSSVD